MTIERNPEILAGFTEEAKGNLPLLVAGLLAKRECPADAGALDEPQRLFHGLKGAAAMVGLSALSHAAFLAEEVASDIQGHSLPWSDEAADFLERASALIAQYLDDLTGGDANDWMLLGEVVVGHRRLRGLPESGDETEILSLMSGAEEGASELAEDGTAPEPVRSTLPPIALPQDDDTNNCPSEVLEAFQQEAEEHLQVIATRLRELDTTSDRDALLLEVRRSVHTIKGAAGMVGLHSLSRLAHRMEDLLDQMAEGDAVFTREIAQLLLTTSDALDDLNAGRADETQLRTVYAAYDAVFGTSGVSSGTAALAAAVARPSVVVEPETILPTFDLEPAASLADDRAERTADGRKSSGQFVRVPIERLDELVRLVSELVVNRSMFERYLTGYRQEVAELEMATERLRKASGRLDSDYEVSALQGVWAGVSVSGGSTRPGHVVPRLPGADRRAEFDALEFDRYTEFHLLTRDIAETTSDLLTANDKLDDLANDFDSYVSRLGRQTAEVQDKLMRLRMLPLSQLSGRLHRTVRVTAEKRDKHVTLVLEGENVELDKTVLEEMAGPLEHVLRNAVDHGIEPSAIRQQRGKPESGTVRLRAFYEGTQVVLQISDDGGGLNPARIRATVVRHGLLTEDEAAQATDRELFQYIFEPGFSTADKVTDVSGRGIGMDVVKSTVTRLKGTLTVDSVAGSGATLTVRLPMTLAIARVLIVEAAQDTLAVPLSAVSQILRVEPDQVERVGQKPVLRVGGKTLPVVRLAEALSLKQVAEPESRRLPVLVLNLGDRQVALLCDKLVEAREVVVKTLGSLLRRVHGITGATLTGDGSVVLIVNPSELAAESRPSQPSVRRRVALPEKALERRTLDVMLVDDSLSVRRVLSNLMRGVGYNPVAARDGMDALDQLAKGTRNPDVILLDVEMPRMDGYELLSTLRGQEAYRDVPVVMLTSRSGEKHRVKAFELGATDYLVKPYQEEALLAVIRRVTGTESA